jgi:hypothetical protein
LFWGWQPVVNAQVANAAPNKHEQRFFEGIEFPFVRHLKGLTRLDAESMRTVASLQPKPGQRKARCVQALGCLAERILRISSNLAASCFSRPSCVGW